MSSLLNLIKKLKQLTVQPSQNQNSTYIKFNDDDAKKIPQDTYLMLNIVMV